MSSREEENVDGENENSKQPRSNQKSNKNQNVVDPEKEVQGETASSTSFGASDFSKLMVLF